MYNFSPETIDIGGIFRTATQNYVISLNEDNIENAAFLYGEEEKIPANSSHKNATKELKLLVRLILLSLYNFKDGVAFPSFINLNIIKFIFIQSYSIHTTGKRIDARNEFKFKSNDIKRINLSLSIILENLTLESYNENIELLEDFIHHSKDVKIINFS